MKAEYQEVLTSFDLERIDDNLFRSRSPNFGWKRIYGGLLIAHALKAAELTIEDLNRKVNSLHGYFIRPGSTSEPLTLSVEHLLDGRTISNRRITILQDNKTVFTAQCSFRTQMSGFVHQPAFPVATDPECLKNDAEIADENEGLLAESTLKYLRRKKIFELRPVNPEEFLRPHPDNMFQGLTWVKLRSGDKQPHEHTDALMGYLSDMTVLNASLPPHGRNFFDPEMIMASLDHTIWFHKRTDWTDWILLSHEAMGNDGGMGLGRVNIFSRSGDLLATVMQQGLIRLHN
ncbi:MAG: acyl-CoA thioesterase domain-containing protein [Anderseniella sp.]